jgi:hypothetical protein
MQTFKKLPIQAPKKNASMFTVSGVVMSAR